MNRKQTLSIVVVVLGFVMCLTGVILSFSEHGGYLGTTEMKQVNCYDNHNNVISDIECTERVIREYDMRIMVLTPSGVIVIFIGLVCLGFALGGKDE